MIREGGNSQCQTELQRRGLPGNEEHKEKGKKANRCNKSEPQGMTMGFGTLRRLAFLPEQAVTGAEIEKSVTDLLFITVRPRSPKVSNNQPAMIPPPPLSLGGREQGK